MDYKEALLHSDVSWYELTHMIKPPKYLYKYQGFFNSDNIPNPYWKQNMLRKFHLSLGCEFEDENDCKPSFDVKKASDDLVKFFEVNDERASLMQLATQDELTEDYCNSVLQNYKKQIHIGCFTDSYNNEHMWNKYAINKTGFCIEYATNLHKLFTSSVFPVCYMDETYDSTQTLVDVIIATAIQQSCKENKRNSIALLHETQRRALKTAYIPLFIKKKEFEKEKEYRLFLLSHRQVGNIQLRANDYLDKNNNIDLSRAIRAIYLGENFDQNPDSSKLLDATISICKEKSIALFQMSGNEQVVMLPSHC